MSPRLDSDMAASAIRKVRLSPDDVKALRRVARAEKTTESDVLRRGIQMQYRVVQRRKAVQGLIDMIEGPEPAKLRFRMKY
jgi:hypothetical protein